MPPLTPTVRAVIQRGDRVLMVQHHYINPANTGKWSLPGGRIAPEDPDHESTLRRELREEFQLEVEIVRFVGAYVYQEREHFLYHVRPCSDRLIPDGHEIAALDWLTVDEVTAQQAAGKLFADFMLDAIRASLEPPPAP